MEQTETIRESYTLPSAVEKRGKPADFPWNMFGRKDGKGRLKELKESVGKISYSKLSSIASTITHCGSATDEQLATLGTSYEEIDKLLEAGLSAGKKIDAKQWLDTLSGFSNIPDGGTLEPMNYAKKYHGYVLETLAEGGLKLEDIGLTDAKLAEILNGVHLRVATRALGYICNSAAKRFALLEMIKEHLAEGGFTILELGITEEEFTKICEAVTLCHNLDPYHGMHFQGQAW